MALDELRGPRWRYRDIERRRREATTRMLQDPSLSYKEAMDDVTAAYMQTPEYAKRRAETGVYSPTRQRKIVDLAGQGFEVEPRITATERETLQWYTGPGHASLNDKLRNRVRLDDDDRKRMIHLDNALAKLPKSPGTTYRVVNFATVDESQQFTAAHVVGEQIYYGQFLSTSKKKGPFGWNERLSAKKVRITIEGKTGRDIAKYSDHPSQKEVLYGRGSGFIVKDVITREHGGYDIILIEE